MTIEEAHALQRAMRDEMLQSLVSPRRTEPRSLLETPLFTTMVLPELVQNPLGRMLLDQSPVDIIPKEMAERISEFFGRDLEKISRYNLLTVSAPVLAQAIGLKESEVSRLKAKLLTAPFRPPESESPEKSSEESPNDPDTTIEA
jgi:hypothetical protein